LIGRNRPAEVETLKLRAAQAAHDVGLPLGLDPFRRRLDAQSASKRQDGMDDGDAIGRALRGAPHEGLVDLDLGEFGAAQIAEAAVALAEIVEHQPDPQRPKPLQRCQSRRIVAQEDAFGHFQFETAGLQAG
jgi:hypothetical protein